MKKWAIGFLGLAVSACDGSPHEEGSSGSGATSPTTGAGGSGGAVETGATGGGGSSGAESDPPLAVYVANQYGDPMANVAIVVNDSDGLVTEEAWTADTGAAQVHVPAEGSVSAFHAYAKSFAIKTVVAPPAGTGVRFELESPAPPPPGEKPATYTISTSGYPAQTYKLRAALDGSCATSQAWAGQTMKLTDARCINGSVHDLLVVAIDDNENAVAWGRASLSAGPGTSASIDVLVNKAGISETTFTFENLPSPVTKLQAWAFVNDGSSQIGSARSENVYSASSFTGLLGCPLISPYDTLFRAAVSIGDGKSGSRIWKSSRADYPLPLEWSVDVAAERWAYLTGLATIEPSHPIFTWSTAPGAQGESGVDVVTLDLTWDLASATASMSVTLPPSHTTEWRMPDIPDDLSSFRPVTGTSFGQVNLAVLELDEVDGYADVVDGMTPHQAASPGARAHSWLNLQ